MVEPGKTPDPVSGEPTVGFPRTDASGMTVEGKGLRGRYLRENSTQERVWAESEGT